MLMRELPCLPLIAERHINAVKSLGVDYKYTDLSLRVFPQVWGSTALGFGGIGGQAMTNGRCAYCGCKLEYKDMQVDHVIPINGWSEQGEDTLDNMLPACRSCNHYKSRSTLEGFRKMVENMPAVLMRDNVTYKNAVRFGLVTPTPHPVKFYFEQLGR